MQRIDLINAIINKDYDVINNAPADFFDLRILSLLETNEINANELIFKKEEYNKIIILYKALYGNDNFYNSLVFNDIELFNMAIEYTKDTYNDNLFDYLNNGEWRLFLMNKNFSISNNQVIDKIIEMGLTDEIYLENFNYDLDSKGHYINYDLIYGLLRNHYNLVGFYLDDIPDFLTFDDYIKKEEYRKTYVFETKIFKYFLKKDPYNLINYMNENTTFTFYRYIEVYFKDDDSILDNQIVINILSSEITSTYNMILRLYRNKDLNKFPPKVHELLKTGYEIANSTGKVNTLDINPNLTYDVIRYIYPIMGKEFTLKMIEFDSASVNNCVELIKKGNGFIVRTMYEYLNKYNLLSNTISPIHYVFEYADKVEDLFVDLAKFQPNLTKEEVLSLESILLNKNCHNIKTYKDLRDYNKVIYMEGLQLRDKFIQPGRTLQAREQILNAIRCFIMSLFGYSLGSDSGMIYANPLFSYVRDFHLNDYSLIGEMLKEIKNKGLPTKDIMITKQDVMLFEIVEKISNYGLSSEEVIEIFNSVTKDGSVEDYTLWLNNYLYKIRKIYNRYFNARLTNPLELEGKKEEKDGVTIIEYDRGKFDFLVHTIKGFDGSAKKIKDSLIEDPSLWTKLEGVTTISTSSISDKNMGYVDDYTEDQVTYLISEVPEDFLLFMSHDDIYTQHGTHHLDPKADVNCYTDLDTLNQRRVIEETEYTEISGFRKGIMPSAILTTKGKITDNLIKHAKYFSEVTGKNVPIIIIDPKKIKERNNLRQREIRRMFFENEDFVLTKEIIREYIYNGSDKSKEVASIISDISTKLIEDYHSSKITMMEYGHLLNYTRTLLNRLYNYESSNEENYSNGGNKDYVRDFDKQVRIIFANLSEEKKEFGR